MATKEKKTRTKASIPSEGSKLKKDRRIRSSAGRNSEETGNIKGKEDKQPTEKEKDAVAKSYNKFKEFNGKVYTGMKVGRSHKWYYDQGEWKEKKITPDAWEFSYNVVKRRAGKAPKGSGVPVGTAYNWYILAHQHVEKLDANSYSTEMKGHKFKLNHKRAGKDKWSVTDKTQRKRLIKVLEEMLHDLKHDE